MPSSYEKQIYKILNQQKIVFETEKTFHDLKHGLLRFDIYIPNTSVGPCIWEIDGQFHFHPIHGREALLKQQENDRRKNAYCLAHNIPLFRIPYWELKNINTINDLTKTQFRVQSQFHNDKLVIPT